MPRYRVVVVSAAGERRDLELRAASPEALLARLRQRKLSAVDMEVLADRPERSWWVHGPLSAELLCEMLRELGSLLEAGLPMLVALDVLGEQGFGRTGEALARAVRAEVAAGGSLADAMAQHRQFDRMVRAVVAAGERSGTLPAVLLRLAEDRLAMLDRQRKLLTALIQPAITLLMAGVAVYVVANVVVPKLAGLYAQIGLELPAITQQVIAVFGLVRDRAPLLLAGLAGGYLALRLGCRSTPFRRAAHAALGRVPVMGRIALWTSLSDAFRIFAMLYRAGIPLLDVLRHAAAAADHQRVRDEMGALRERVEAGRTLADAAREPPLFDRFCRAMLEVGEQTGSLDTQLDRIAVKLDRALDHAYARIEAVFTPALTILLVAVVGYVLVALYMPFVALIEKLAQPR